MGALVEEIKQDYIYQASLPVAARLFVRHPATSAALTALLAAAILLLGYSLYWARALRQERRYAPINPKTGVYLETVTYSTQEYQKRLKRALVLRGCALGGLAAGAALLLVIWYSDLSLISADHVVPEAELRQSRGRARKLPFFSSLRTAREMASKYRAYAASTADVIRLEDYSPEMRDCYLSAEPFEYFCLVEWDRARPVRRYKLEGWLWEKWSLDSLIEKVNHPAFPARLQEFLKHHHLDRDISKYLKQAEAE